MSFGHNAVLHTPPFVNPPINQVYIDVLILPIQTPFFFYFIACTESCYSEIPDSIIYAEVGDSFNVTIVHTEVFSFNLYNTTSGTDVFCDPEVCVVHDRRLEIKRFQPYLEGNYEFRFNYSMLGEFCAINFTLKRARMLSVCQCVCVLNHVTVTMVL